MDFTADLLLTFVWDKAASGTARSKTSLVLLTVPEAVLSHTNSEERISFNSFYAPCCPRGGLVPYKSEENEFHPVLVLLGPGVPMATKDQ